MPRLDDLPPGFIEDRATRGLSRVSLKGEETLSAEEVKLLVDFVQMTADVIGFVDPTPTCDGVSMVISLTQGDLFSATLSIISMVPFIGDAAKLGRLPKYKKVLDRVIHQVKRSDRFATLVKPFLHQLHGGLQRIPAFLPDKVADEVRSIRGVLDGYFGVRAVKALKDFKEAERLGIPAEHVRAIRDAIMANNPMRFTVYVRAGKQNAIEWIRRGYPAKPREIKAETDNVIGLVIAKKKEEAEQAIAAGHYVVQNGKAVNGSTVAPIDALPEWGHMPDGLIIDKTTLKPFTSDFDIGYIANPQSTKQQLALVKSDVRKVEDYLDPREQAMIDNINHKMVELKGGGRIMHGPDNKFSNHYRNDPHLEFLPDGTVRILEEGEFSRMMTKAKNPLLNLKSFQE